MTKIFNSYEDFLSRSDKNENGVNQAFVDALENKTSTLFAAMQIYKASSEIKVSPVRFFEGNETALADMKRCMDLENSNA